MSNKGLFSDPIALLVVHWSSASVLAVMLILFAASRRCCRLRLSPSRRSLPIATTTSWKELPQPGQCAGHTVKERTDYLTPEQDFHLASPEQTLLNQRIEEDTDLYSLPIAQRRTSTS